MIRLKNGGYSRKSQYQEAAEYGKYLRRLPALYGSYITASLLSDLNLRHPYHACSIHQLCCHSV